MSTPNRTDNFSKKQLGIIFKIAFLEAMALSLILPSVVSTGEVASSTQLIGPIQWFASSPSGLQSLNSMTTGTQVAVSNSTTSLIVVIISGVQSNGAHIPHLRTVCDLFDCLFTNIINASNTVLNYEMWFKFLPAQTTGNFADGITATWNMTTVSAIVASAFINVQTITNPNFNTGNVIPTTTNLIFPTLKSGSIIVGGVATAQSSPGNNPNGNDLIQRAIQFNKGNPITCTTKCTTADIEDTNSTQYLDHFSFDFSENLVQGLGTDMNWISGSAELQSILTEPKIGTQYCTATAPANCLALYCGVGTANCSTVVTGGNCYWYVQKSNAVSTLTGQVFVTISSTSWICPPSTTSPIGPIMCSSSYIFSVNATTAKGEFQLKDASGTVQVSTPFEYNPDTANMNQTVAINWEFAIHNAPLTEVIQFNARVTGSNMQLKVWTGAFYCLDVFTSGSGTVG